MFYFFRHIFHTFPGIKPKIRENENNNMFLLLSNRKLSPLMYGTINKLYRSLLVFFARTCMYLVSILMPVLSKTQRAAVRTHQEDRRLPVHLTSAWWLLWMIMTALGCRFVYVQSTESVNTVHLEIHNTTIRIMSMVAIFNLDMSNNSSNN